METKLSVEEPESMQSVSEGLNSVETKLKKLTSKSKVYRFRRT